MSIITRITHNGGEDSFSRTVIWFIIISIYIIIIIISIIIITVPSLLLLLLLLPLLLLLLYRFIKSTTKISIKTLPDLQTVLFDQTPGPGS